jgi:hypothetical protein
MVGVVLRHLAAFLIGVGGVLALARYAPPAEQPIVWLVGGLVIGLVGALVGRGWLGFLFVATGVAVGVWLDPTRSASAAGSVFDTVSEASMAYAGALIGAVVAYAAATMAMGARRVSRPNGLRRA